MPGIKVGRGVSQAGPQEEQAMGRPWRRSGEGEGAGEGAGLSGANPNASSWTSSKGTRGRREEADRVPTGEEKAKSLSNA